jgi:hypothetical protein
MATCRVMPPLRGSPDSSHRGLPMAGAMGYNISPLPGLDVGSASDPGHMADKRRFVGWVLPRDRLEPLADTARPGGRRDGATSNSN